MTTSNSPVKQIFKLLYTVGGWCYFILQVIMTTHVAIQSYLLCIIHNIQFWIIVAVSDNIICDGTMWTYSGMYIIRGVGSCGIFPPSWHLREYKRIYWEYWYRGGWVEEAGRVTVGSPKSGHGIVIFT